MSYNQYRKTPSIYGKELLLKNIPFITIYNHPGKSEFLLLSEKYQLEILIECKWQQSTGSIDEKFPYLYLNCIEKIPQKHIFIILDGGGSKRDAISWLKKVCIQNQYISNVTANCQKEIKILTLTEFIIWANNTFR